MADEIVFQDGAEVQMPEPVLGFLRLCLVAGLYNGLGIFALVLLKPLPHPPPANVLFPFAFHVFVALLGAVMFMPILALPYWLALGFIYSRNEWARVLLYIGAGLMILMTLALAARSGIAFLGMFGACLPGVGALICLEQRSARAFLHKTLPVFVVRARQY
jgi:hypothetical protein